MKEWKIVVFAPPPTEDDDEPPCVSCGGDYAECECLGPTEEDVDYKTVKGVMYGRRRK